MELTTKIMAAGGGQIASPNFLEAYMVLKRHLKETTKPVLSSTLGGLDIVIVPFTAEHAGEATQAFDRFGKGNHPAKLNFGDCAAYALAKVSGQALLFVGEDFSKTDVRIA